MLLPDHTASKPRHVPFATSVRVQLIDTSFYQNGPIHHGAYANSPSTQDSHTQMSIFSVQQRHMLAIVRNIKDNTASFRYIQEKLTSIWGWRRKRINHIMAIASESAWYLWKVMRSAWTGRHSSPQAPEGPPQRASIVSCRRNKDLKRLCP